MTKSLHSKKSITIGIPAFNEEKNIKALVMSIIKQEMADGFIQKILIVSDGSTDKTNNEVKSIKNKRVKLIINKSRLGLNKSENIIIKNTKSDILVILNADVLPDDNRFIHNLINPIIRNSRVGIVGASVVPLKPRNIFESIISYSHNIKTEVYRRLKTSNNIYLCHGRGRAFSKPFYKTLRWPEDCPEDAYSYLWCRKKRFKFIYRKDAQLLFRSPTNLNDHIKQSLRFTIGKNKLIKYFGKARIDKEYKIEKSIIFKTLLLSLMLSPVLTGAYLSILLYTIVMKKKRKIDLILWDASSSSKTLLV